MKKALNLFLALSMVMVLSLGGSIQAFGESAASQPTAPLALQPAGTLRSEALTATPQQDADPWPLTLESGSDAGGYVPNQALVMFRASDEPLTKSQAIRALSTGNHSIGDFKVKNLWTFQPKPEYTTNTAGKKKLVLVGKDDTEYVQVALVTSKSQSTAQLISTLKKRSDVLHAEPNYRVKVQSVTDDPYSDYQWSMQSGDATPNVSHQWETTGTTGSDKIVAVVDTGVDYTHPDLQDNMWVNTHYPALKGVYGIDFAEGDADPMDDNGHGTHCAGIIGAVGNNGVGISGVNQDIKIMALKYAGEDGSGSYGAAIAAYEYIDRALDLGEPVVAINLSFGNQGVDDGAYEILTELVNVVGEKGAITVAAAGNASSDNDAAPTYPANLDSPYIISVAAAREDGALAAFSNYGRQTVDIAAPGANILSTVSYSSYNPSIYGDRQHDYSARFDDFEGEAGQQSVTEFAENVYVNGEKTSLTYSDGAYRSHDGKVVISQSNRAFVPQGTAATGSSLQIETSNLAKGDLVCLPVPYQVGETARSAPRFSVMGMTKSDGYNGFLMYDVEQGTSLSKDGLNGREPKHSQSIGKSDFDVWRHLTFPTMGEAELQEAIRQSTEGEAGAPDPLERWVVLCIEAGDGGNAKVNLDDMGVSVDPTDKAPDYFGKYDFISGTSQATPYVSGAVALKAAELGDDADPATLVNEVLAMARTDDRLPVAEGRSLDFRAHPAELAPRVGKITVNADDGTLTIHGSGLAPSTGTTVEIGDGENSLAVAQIVSKTDRAVTVKDEGWINNVKTVKVTGYQGKSDIRRDVYLVNGKKSLAEGDWCGVSVTDFGMATDGKRIYWTDKDTGTIQAVDPGNLEAGQATIATIRPEKIFGTKKSEVTTYRMGFCEHLTYCNGSLYTILEYTASYDVEGAPTTDYSGELRLVGVSLGGDASGAGPAGAVTNLGKLPADLEKVEDCTMAAFNGKLYFMGGYLHDGLNQGVTDKVWIYDPATKAWSAGPSLPEGRAGGRALQCGGSLVLAMGYTDAMAGIDIYDQSYSATLVFDGEKWTTGEKRIEPLMIRWAKRQNGVYYLFPEPEISLVKGGLLFTGQPVEDYGDVFFYTTDGDEFADSGYNFVGNPADGEMRGITVGGTFYGFADGYVYQLPVESGLVEVAAAASPHGTVTGTGSFVPGNTATANVAADSGYRIKSLQLNGKAVELAGNPTSYALTLKDLVEDQLIAAEFEPAPLEPLDIAGAKVSSVADQVFDGTEKRPAVTVTLAGKTLTPGADYSVDYRDNKNVGTATVVVTGMSAGTGGYTGTVTSTFRIVKAPNPLSPKGKTVNVSYYKLKSKSQVVKRAKAIGLGKPKPKGKVTYKKLWGDGLISVNKKTGNLTLAKGLKPYVYEVGVLISASGNDSYSPAKDYVIVTVKVGKGTNPMTAKGKTATVSAAKVKKKSRTIAANKAFSVTRAQGKVTYKKTSGNKKITVAKSGKITVKKGLGKGVYKIKVKVAAKGNAKWRAKTETVTATVIVK